MIVEFGEYLPDQPDIGGVTTALNCAPQERGYTELLGLSALTNALTARVQGSFAIRDSVGNPYNLAGDATKLYLLSGTTYSDISNGTYNLASVDRWEFAKYGNRVIAVNGDGAPQSYTFGEATCEDLPGSPPNGRTIAVVGNYVLLGDVVDSVDGDMPHRVWWSATNNPESWTAGTNQCDYRTFEGSGGRIQRIIGGEWATIFQERAIVRLTYVGAPLVFEADEIENRGTDAPGSVIRLGRFIFYKSVDGFYMFNGEYSEPIGAGKVDKTLLNDIDTDYLHRITAQIDPKLHLVKWSYPGSGNSGGTPNKMAIYHWPSKKWSIANLAIEAFSDYLEDGYSLEDLDAFGDLDSLTDSLDSYRWMQGDPILSAFDTSHQLGNFTGSPLAAQMETPEIQFYPGYKATVRELRPIIDAGTPVLTIGTRNNQTDTESYGSAITVAASGRYAARSTARYHRIKVTTSTTFTHGVGVDVQAIKRGSR